MASVKNRGYVTVSKIRAAEAKSMRNERGQDQHGRPQFKNIADQAAELAVYAATHTDRGGAAPGQERQDAAAVRRRARPVSVISEAVTPA